MHFLIDENLPRSIGVVFTQLGFVAEHVRDTKQLHGQPDEVIFEYATENKLVIVTRDLNFANPIRFNLSKLPGIVLLRFPNDISIERMCTEVLALGHSLKEKDWNNIVILEPGSLRIRKI